MSESISNPFQQLADNISDVLNDKLEAIKKELEGIKAGSTRPAEQGSIPKGYISAKKAADYLDVNVKTIEARRDEGLLTCYRFGRMVRYRYEDLDELLRCERANY